MLTFLPFWSIMTLDSFSLAACGTCTLTGGDFFIHAVPASACSGNRGESDCAVAAGAFDSKAVSCIAVNAHRFSPTAAAREKVGKMIAIKAVHGVASVNKFICAICA